MKPSVAVAAVVLGACVPSTVDVDPRGACGVVTAPTPGTLGEPFLTDDGWTVTVDVLYVRAQLTVEPVQKGRDGYARARSFLWNARDRREIFVRGVPAGPTTTSLRLTTGFVVSGDSEELDFFVEPLDVPQDIARRFTRPADGANAGLLGSSSAPSMLVIARGEKSGRAVSLDLTLDADGVTSSLVGNVEVVADELRVTPHAIAVEELFRVGESGRRAFQPIADADEAGDQDGRVTGPELAAALLSCEGLGGLGTDALGETCKLSLLDVLKLRAPGVVGSRAVVGFE